MQTTEASLLGHKSVWDEETADLMGKMKNIHQVYPFHGEGDGTPHQSSCLENPMDRGAWQAAVHGVAKNRTRLSDFTFTHWRRKWQPTPVFLPGESQGWQSLVGFSLWGCTESDMTQQQQHTLSKALPLQSIYNIIHELTMTQTFLRIHWKKICMIF